MLKKIGIVIVGTFLMGSSFGLCLMSGLGADSMSVLCMGVSIQLQMSVGVVSFGISLIMVVVTLFIDRKQFHVGTFTSLIMISIAIDMVMKLSLPESLVIRFIILIVAIVVIGFSSALVASANLGKGPYDALIYGLEKKTGVSLVYWRYGIEAIFLVCGYLVGGVFGIGTILSLLLVGPIIDYSRKILKKVPFLNEEKVQKESTK